MVSLSTDIITAKTVAYVRDIARSFMDSVVTITRPEDPTYSYAGIVATPVFSGSYIGYNGVAHIHPTSGSGITVVGDMVLSYPMITVSLPWDAAPLPRKDDLLHVDAMEPRSLDTELVGKLLRIMDVSLGGIGFPVRTLSCTYVAETEFTPDA